MQWYFNIGMRYGDNGVTNNYPRLLKRQVGITKDEIEEAIRTSGKKKSSSQIEKELEKLKAKKKGQNLRKQQKHKHKDKDQFKVGDEDEDEDVYIDSDTNGDIYGSPIITVPMNLQSEISQLNRIWTIILSFITYPTSFQLSEIFNTECIDLNQ
ncbi:MAG: hypothetical protein EZS28_016195 [Streblomastix strix]|uniref:Uncharacterized protein n=1 Tax=Streblomastix strix TaxID=222440 RepID=A0A5J4W0B2_9EUKA|nr:MAG: hypothetical protein EZS28_016195 [Streblomastix strix]